MPSRENFHASHGASKDAGASGKTIDMPTVNFHVLSIATSRSHLHCIILESKSAAFRLLVWPVMKTHIPNVFRYLLVSALCSSTLRHIPTIDLPPPSSNPTPQSRALELRPSIPEPPSTQHQCPYKALRQRQYHLVPPRHVRNSPPGFHAIQTGEV